MSTRHDYKPRPRTKVRASTPGRARSQHGESPSRVPGWLWLLTGAAVGSFAMFLYELQQDPTAPASAAQVLVPAPALESPEPGVVAPAPSAAEEPADYDFYTLLPAKQITIPEEELRSENERSREPPPIWMLQAGSFRTYSDADRLKAVLAFQGLESAIDTVSGSTGTWHRVRLGPYASRREVDRIRSKLARDNIEGLILRTDN